MAAAPSQAIFPETRWSIIQRASASSAAISREALEELCRSYWPPLYAFLRRSGKSPEESQDLVQGFLARLLARDDLADVVRERGKFRSFLLAGLQNFTVSEIRRETAQKRGGENRIAMDLDSVEESYAAAIADGVTPAIAFDRRWADTVVERAIEALGVEYAARGKGRFFELLKTSIADGAEENYAALGRELNLTPGAVAVAVHRLRLRFRELVRAEVAQTVGCAADLDEEMRSLFAALSR